MLELFLEFLKLGAFTIGGGIAMIPVLTDSMTRKGWFTEEEMVDIISVCQSLPGVVGSNMATYVGFRRHGLPGSLVAAIGVNLPSVVIIILVAKGLSLFAGSSVVMGAMAGLRAAAAGLVVVATWQVAQKSIKDIWTALIAVSSFCLIRFAHCPVAVVILIFLATGAVQGLVGAGRIAEKDGGEEK